MKEKHNFSEKRDQKLINERKELVPEDVAAATENPEVFRLSREEKKRKKRKFPKKISRETIHSRISYFLDRIEVDEEESTDEEEDEVPQMEVLENQALSTNL